MLMARLTALLASTAMLLTLGSCSLLPGQDDIEVTAYFPETSGLFIGNDVGILGVTVGEITAIEPDGDRVKVTLKVDGDVDVPADVGAVVTSRSVATDRYIELTPVYKDGPRLEDGAEIDRTDTPVDFDEVLSTLSQFAKDIGGDKDSALAVRRFLRVGAKAFGGNGKYINDSIVALGGAVDAVSGQRDNILGTLKSLDVLTQSFAANERTIHRFTRSVAAAAQLLASERRNIKGTLTSLGESIEVVSRFARTHRSELLGSVDKLADLIRIILKSREDFEETIEVLPLALQNVMGIFNYEDGLATARLNPVYLAPLLGQELQLLCQGLPLNLCDTIALQPGTPISDLLGGLL